MRGAFACRTGVRVKTNELKEWSEEDIEGVVKDPTISLGITCLIEPIRVVSEQIAAIEKVVLKRARLREEFGLLKTVWGIGPVLVLTIMVEVGEFSRFAQAVCMSVAGTGARIGAGQPCVPEWTCPGPMCGWLELRVDREPRGAGALRGSPQPEPLPRGHGRLSPRTLWGALGRQGLGASPHRLHR
jgi:hypothetical protein